jgi:hypothetical protein
VRRAESTRLRAKSKKAAQRLKHLRWPLRDSPKTR